MIVGKRVPAFDASRLWRRVDKSAGVDACWPWSGSKTSQGYGQITIAGSVFKCHRVVLQLTQPTDDMTKYACHTCDNPSCCNPKHLYWGSAKQNVADRETRSNVRRAYGVRHHKAKLDPEKIRSIRKLAGSMSQRALAAKFGVAQGVIWNIIHRRFWKEVDD